MTHFESFLQDVGFKPEHFQHPSHKRRTLDNHDYAFVGIPAEHWSAQIHGVQQSVKPIIDSYIKCIVPLIAYCGIGLWLVGDRGVGKSAIAALLAKVAWAHTFHTRFISVADLRQAIVSRAEVYENKEMFVHCREVDFLVLDDLTLSDSTAKIFGREEIRSLVRRRRDSRLTTVITTRLGPAELEEHFGDIVSSTDDGMPVVVVSGEDLRRDRAKALANAVSVKKTGK